MEYFCLIQSIVSYIEARVREQIDYAHLESVTGFSYPHLREVFRKCTRIPLGKYADYRKISHGAFELIHSHRTILTIALDLGYAGPDTFTRAFRRVTGMNPGVFRKQNIVVGRCQLTGGVFGPGILGAKIGLNLPPLLEETMQKTETSKAGKVEKHEGSCILYGVPKVQYTHEECTPLPACLKAVLNYMGQVIDYGFIMGASGAAFRLRWRTSFWDGGNVDICYIYENPFEAFTRAFQAAGRAYSLLERTANTRKEDFIAFLKPEIDAGRPVIALGLIGPPEACLITGYRDEGETLLGWNFFQANPEFAMGVTFAESGYFISGSWWENKNTVALLSIGEEFGTKTAVKDLLENAVTVLTKESFENERQHDVAGGPAAYTAWAGALLDESQFPPDATLPALFERLMCQVDALTMVGEGRAYAAAFLNKLAETTPAAAAELTKAANLFCAEYKLAMNMAGVIGGFEMSELKARNLARRENREKIAVLIREACKLDILGTQQIRAAIMKLN